MKRRNEQEKAISCKTTKEYKINKKRQKIGKQCEIKKKMKKRKVREVMRWMQERKARC